MQAHGVEDPALRADLLSAYRELGAYPDAAPTLEALRGRGLATAILSNGTPEMLAAAVEAGGLGQLLDDVLSVHPLRRYKPDARVYALATERFACQPHEIAFVSSNAWDAYGAARFGFRVFWVNRSAGPIGVLARRAGGGRAARPRRPAAAARARDAGRPPRRRDRPARRGRGGRPRRPADAIANDFFRARRYIGGGDRRAISDRVWGVLRRRLRLGWWLDQVGARPTPRMLVAADLLLAEALDLSAVLRAFPGGQYAPEPLTAPEERLLRAVATRRGGGRGLDHRNMPEAVRLELPDWALPGFRARFGPRLAEEAAAMAMPAPLDLRANLLKTTRESARTALAAEGIETEPTPFSPWGLRVPDRRPVTATGAFRDGLVEVQDEGSQLVVLLTGARAGMRVADYCAGAGGKTLALAAAMGNRGRITACDVSATRLEGAVRRLRRAGVDNAERHLLEPGDRWAKRRAGAFDRVLVDAPCTGTGTWRRNPRRAHSAPAPRTSANSCPSRPRSSTPPPGWCGPAAGASSTRPVPCCPPRTRSRSAPSSRRHPDFSLLPPSVAWAEAGVSAPPPPPEEGEFLLTSPARHGTDGFFAAILQRGTS